MKRSMLAVAVAAALLLPAGGAHAASLYSVRQIWAFYSGGGSSVSVSAFVVEDLTGNTPPSAYASVSVQTPMGSDSGTGALAVTVDPTATIGSVTGTVAGNDGPITIDLTYLGLSVNTSQPPLVYGNLNPGVPNAYAGYFYEKTGSAIVNATFAYGTMSAPGANAYASFGFQAMAP